MSQDENKQVAQPDFCSGKMSESGLLEYMDVINSAVRDIDSSSIRDSRLFADNITLVTGGKIIQLTPRDLNSFAGELPAQEDWQIVASLLAAGKLFPVGWRGCILSNGKAAFVANAEGRLGLSSFDFDQDWEK